MEERTRKSVKVSVVVAVYNTGRYLAKMLDSVLAQTLTNIEVICVDDGSTDDSLETLYEYASKDDRIIVLQQKESSDGAALARNMGLKTAGGEFVAVLDSDDFFECDMLEKAWKCAIDTESEIVLFDGYLHDDKTGLDKETGMILREEYLPKKPCFLPEEIRDDLFFITIGAAWNALFSRELINREHLSFHSFHHADDLGFVYLAFATANKISYLSNKFVHYRVNNAGSQAANLEKWPDAAGGALTRFKDELEKRNLLEKYQVSFVQLALKYFDTYSNAITDGKVFEGFYTKWRSRYYNSLELDAVEDKSITQSRLMELRKALCSMTAAEYLFRKLHGMFPFDWKRRIINDVKKGSKIILYGAGKFGTEVFADLIGSRYYRVMGWADQACETLGFPVMSPKTINTIEYDSILVAVESRMMYQRIFEDLKEMKISEDKIVWIGSGI